MTTQHPHGRPSVADTHPRLIPGLLAAGTDPTAYSHGSNKEVQYTYLDTCGHTVPIKVAKLCKGQTCSVCSPYSTRVLVGVNDCATVRPDIADGLTAAGEDPTAFRPQSNRKVNYRNPDCGHLNRRVSLPALHRQYCSTCYGRTVIADENSVAAVRPDLVPGLLAAGTDPTTITVQSNKPVAYQHPECGHIQRSVLMCNVTNGTGCGVCAGQEVQRGVNSVADTHPHLIAGFLAAGTDPYTLTAWANRAVAYQYPCGCIGKPTMSNLAMGKGCWKHATRGYTTGNLGVLYVVGGWVAGWTVKVGIANIDSAASRLRTHHRQRLTHVWGTVTGTGENIAAAESDVARFIGQIRKSSRCRVDRLDLPDGATEAVRNLTGRTAERLAARLMAHGVPGDGLVDWLTGNARQGQCQTPLSRW